MRRRFGALALAAVLVLAPTAGAQEPQASLPDIEDEVMCTICGTLLELAENSQADREREFIRDLIAQGLTKEQIKDRLVAEFGTEVLAIPDDEGFDLVAWVVPGLAIVLAGVAIFVGLRRWRRAGASDEGEGSAEPPAESDSERLDADLARYEL